MVNLKPKSKHGHMNLTVETQCPLVDTYTPKDEKILIFGGSGSLGTKLIHRWIASNKIMNVSRDEEKQWQLRSSLSDGTNLQQYIGDISDYKDVENCLHVFKPTLVIVAAALKHIDICERYPSKSLQMNVHGICNVQRVLENFPGQVHTVLFVSTDKACKPLTVYGYSKATSEAIVQNAKSPIRYIGVRYGNVLNSSGSIIPYLRKGSTTAEPYRLTHTDMTRYLMTLDNSVNLIEYAIQHAKQNEIIIPFLLSMKIQDLFELFCEKYQKTFQLTGLRCKEKIHEDILSEFEAKQAYVDNGYIHITNKDIESTLPPMNSSMNNITKADLKIFLEKNQYL
jgi:FlaA1/EpsC-like NDP-sugar epimerase